MQNIDRYLIIALFSGYVAKLLVSGASFADAAVVLVMAATYFLYNWQIQNKQLTELNQSVRDLKADLDNFKKDHSDLKNAVAGVKITQGLRNIK